MKAEIKHLEQALVHFEGDIDFFNDGDKGWRLKAGAMYHGKTLQECFNKMIFSMGEHHLKYLEASKLEKK